MRDVTPDRVSNFLSCSMGLAGLLLVLPSLGCPNGPLCNKSGPAVTSAVVQSDKLVIQVAPGTVGGAPQSLYILTNLDIQGGANFLFHRNGTAIVGEPTDQVSAGKKASILAVATTSPMLAEQLTALGIEVVPWTSVKIAERLIEIPLASIGKGTRDIIQQSRAQAAVDWFSPDTVSRDPVLLLGCASVAIK